MADILAGRQADKMRKTPSVIFVADTDKDDNGDYFMNPGDLVVVLTVAAAFDLILPPVALCAGNIYTLKVRARSAGAATLKDYQQNGDAAGDSDNWQGNYTLDAVDDAILLYSDGQKWFPILNEIS